MNRQEFSAGTVVFIAIMTFVLLPCVVRSSIAQTAPAAAPLQNTLPQKNQAQQTAPQPAASQPAAPQNVAQGNFFKRLANAYRQDWKGTTPSGPAQAFRGDPAPINAPPFPFTTWPIGGTVTIGYPWTQSGPLMQAIWSGGHGDWWKKNGIQIYGWLNFGGNWSTSHNVSNGQALCGATPPLNCKYGNFPESYDEVGNSIQPDQEVIYIERQPDTVQTDHFDWGFRIANLWGLDYRFTTAYGIFSQQLLSKNKEYGDDPVMFYADLYFPHVAQGMDVRIGRYISLPDIEAQLAPNNYTYSHSLLYTFDCYTQTGINTTTRLNEHWTVQVGVSPGCEIAPWKQSGSLAKLTLNACVQYLWRDAQDDIYFCANSINSGKYAYNNLNAYYFTWYHKINATWHTATESWYQYERDTPNLNNPNVGLIGSSVPDPLLIFGANGARCNNTTETTCFAPEWAMVNYLEEQLGPHNYISVRNEVFDDIRGQRTGTKGWYTEHLFGWGHWIGTTVLLRPEVRWEHIYNPNLGLTSPPPGTKNELPGAYDNGLRHSQLTLASDIIWFF
ncbi:MAG: outer membrane beta-barrel protein [Candidatus Acidiferrales bacterium]